MSINEHDQAAIDYRFKCRHPHAGNNPVLHSNDKVISIAPKRRVRILEPIPTRHELAQPIIVDELPRRVLDRLDVGHGRRRAVYSVLDRMSSGMSASAQ